MEAKKDMREREVLFVFLPRFAYTGSVRKKTSKYMNVMKKKCCARPTNLISSRLVGIKCLEIKQKLAKHDSDKHYKKIYENSKKL